MNYLELEAFTFSSSMCDLGQLANPTYHKKKQQIKNHVIVVIRVLQQIKDVCLNVSQQKLFIHFTKMWLSSKLLFFLLILSPPDLSTQVRELSVEDNSPLEPRPLWCDSILFEGFNFNASSNYTPPMYFLRKYVVKLSQQI